MTAHTHQTALTQYVKAHANPYEYPQAIQATDAGHQR